MTACMDCVLRECRIAGFSDHAWLAGSGRIVRATYGKSFIASEIRRGERVVSVRPLAPGCYEFFDEFQRETGGVLVVQ
jgi:hypothetical protein